MVGLPFADDNDALSGPKQVSTICDPAAGTGGMPTTAADYPHKLNADIVVEVHGQKISALSSAAVLAGTPMVA